MHEIILISSAFSDMFAVVMVIFDSLHWCKYMYIKNIAARYKSSEGHRSVVICVRPVTQRSLIQTLLWSLNAVPTDVQNTLFLLSQPILSTFGVKLRWTGALFRGDNDAHLLSTTETEYKHLSYDSSWFRAGFNYHDYRVM